MVQKRNRIMKFFDVKELCVSDTYPKLVVVPKEGTAEYNNIVNLIDNLLDPVRAKAGKPITVNSGYRNASLNRAVGGSATSNHLKGCAADCVTGNKASDNMSIVKALVELGIDYDECLVEKAVFNAKGEIVSAGWIHLAYRKGANRRKLLWTKNLKDYYPIKVKRTFQ